MSSLQITNQTFNYTNKNINYDSNSPKRNIRPPSNLYNKINYGSKIREKNNYILYVSGCGYEKPLYEECQKGIPIKTLRNKYDMSNNCYIYKNKRNYTEYEEDNDNILSSSDNYGYKETKNIKRDNPNLKILTIHERLGSPRRYQHIYSPKRNKKLKINKAENIYWHRDFSPNRNKRIHINNNNEQIKILRENKSYDNLQSFKKQKYFEKSFHNQRGREREREGELIQEIIEPDNDDYNDNNYYNNNNNYNNKMINEYPPKIETTKDGEYFIKVTTKRKEINNNEYNDNNKYIKINKKNEPLYNEEDNEIYNKKHIRNNYEKEPYYIGNYGDEENYESIRQYKENEENEDINDRYITREEYNTQEDDYGYQNKNQMDMNSMGYKGYDKYNEEKEYIEDISEIKKIECPLHGKISIIIHKNPFGYN